MRYPKFNWRTQPRGTKERVAILCGFWADLDSNIRKPNGDLMKLHQDAGGYLRFCAEGKVVLVHRFIWHFTFGDIDPKKVIDHIDRDRQNNCITNLREVSVGENNKNRNSFDKYKF